MSQRAVGSAGHRGGVPDLGGRRGRPGSQPPQLQAGAGGQPGPHPGADRRAVAERRRRQLELTHPHTYIQTNYWTIQDICIQKSTTYIHSVFLFFKNCDLNKQVTRYATLTSNIAVSKKSSIIISKHTVGKHIYTYITYIHILYTRNTQ